MRSVSVTKQTSAMADKPSGKSQNADRGTARNSDKPLNTKPSQDPKTRYRSWFGKERQVIRTIYRSRPTTTHPHTNLGFEVLCGTHRTRPSYGSPYRSCICAQYRQLTGHAADVIAYCHKGLFNFRGVGRCPKGRHRRQFILARNSKKSPEQKNRQDESPKFHQLLVKLVRLLFYSSIFLLHSRAITAHCRSPADRPLLRYEDIGNGTFLTIGGRVVDIDR